MEYLELLVIHFSTILVIVVGVSFLIWLWPLRREKVFGSLLLFVLMITALYFLVLTLRFPTPEKNLTEYFGGFIYFSLFICEGLIPYFGSVFSVFTIGPKHKKIWTYLLTVLVGIYVVILSINPPIYSETKEELIITGLTASYFYVLVAMMFVPASLFLFTLLKSKGRAEITSNSLLFLGLLMLGLLVMISESFAVFPPIAVRRVLVALALISLYCGFFMPGWLRKVLRL